MTEGVYGSPDENLVYREPLDFHHIRRPVQNQTEVVGRLTGFGTHNVLAGYEYHRDKYRTEVTAGDDPDCICGYWWLTIAPMDITTMHEEQGPLDIDTVARTTFVNDTDAFLLRAGPDRRGAEGEGESRLPARRLLAGRRSRRRPAVHATASWTRRPARIGRASSMRRVSTSSSTWPRPRRSRRSHTVPADGTQLDPSTARNYEVGHRWQGLNGRVDTTAAFYYTIRNNVTVQESVISFIQVGEQRSKGFDFDLNTDLGNQTSLIFNYGFAAPKFTDDEELDGKTPRFAPKHNVNLWLRKDFRGGLNAAFGFRYLSEQFTDDENDTDARQLRHRSRLRSAIAHPRWDWTVNFDNLFNNEDYFLAGTLQQQRVPGSADQRHHDDSAEVELTGRAKGQGRTTPIARVQRPAAASDGA